MMFWQEERDEDKPYQVPDDIIDINYRITARTLPLDHAHALSSALLERCPGWRRRRLPVSTSFTAPSPETAGTGPRT